jgi:hypothetical protein
MLLHRQRQSPNTPPGRVVSTKYGPQKPSLNTIAPQIKLMALNKSPHLKVSLTLSRRHGKGFGTTRIHSLSFVRD